MALVFSRYDEDPLSILLGLLLRVTSQINLVVPILGVIGIQVVVVLLHLQSRITYQTTIRDSLHINKEF